MPRVFVVTGSNKGVGRSIVKLLLQDKEEKIVYLTSRNEELGQKTVKEFEEMNLKLLYHQLDITDQKSIDRLRDHLSEKHGGLDVLVNNAGITLRGDCPYFGAVATTGCNFFGTLNVCEGLKDLLRSNGRIVNVSSISSINAFKRLSSDLKLKFTDPGLTIEGLHGLITDFVNATKLDADLFTQSGWPTSAYGISKLGVTVFTRLQQNLFDETEPQRNITISCCCPGFVETDMTSKKHGQYDMVLPDKGADTVVYLALLPVGSSEMKGCFWQERKMTPFPPDESYT